MSVEIEYVSVKARCPYCRTERPHLKFYPKNYGIKQKCDNCKREFWVQRDSFVAAGFVVEKEK